MRNHLSSLLLLAVVALGVYYNSLDGQFVWDDVSSVVFNEFIKSPEYIPNLFVTDLHHFGRGQGNFYRPLVALSFMADYQLWGNNPFGYHLTNVLLHLAVGLLVYALAFTLMKDLEVSLAAALIYLVHPVHTEAVAYISGRADMLSTGLILASLILFIRWERSGEAKKRDFAQQPEFNLGPWNYVASLVCFCLALLAKEVSVIFPALLVVYLCSKPREETDRAKPGGNIMNLSPFIGIALGYAVLRGTLLNFSTQPLVPTDIDPFGVRLVSGMKVFAEYLNLLVAPIGLHMERVVSSEKTLLAIGPAVGLALFVAFIALLWWVRKREHWVFFGLLWFLIALIPVVGLFPTNAPMAEHWLYQASIGFWIAVAVAIMNVYRAAPSLLKRRTLRLVCWIVVVAFCVYLSVFTVRRNKDWQDNVSIYAATLRCNPESLRARYNLAVTYDSIGELKDAEVQYQEVLKRYPDFLPALMDQAAIQIKQKNGEGAIELYRKAIAASPDNPDAIEAYVNLAQLLVQKRDYAEASQLYLKAQSLTRDPGVLELIKTLAQDLETVSTRSSSPQN